MGRLTPMTAGRRMRKAWFAALGGALLLAGCGAPPQVSPENRRLIESLRTAVSTQRQDWLESNVKLIDEQAKAGKMNDDERQAFVEIVELARQGNWSKAQDQVIRLGKAQRPGP